MTVGGGRWTRARVLPLSPPHRLPLDELLTFLMVPFTCKMGAAHGFP